MSMVHVFARRYRFWICLLLLACAVSIGFLVNVSSLAKHEQYVLRTHCAHNLRMIGASTLMYVADFDDRLMGVSWVTALAPYGKDEDFDCPEQRKSGQHFGYAMASHIVLIHYDKIISPEAEPLIFDFDYLNANAIADPSKISRNRHERIPNLLFADGHVDSGRLGTSSGRP